MARILFLSDFHLGIPDEVSSRIREKKICNFLDQQFEQTDELFLVGDIFDFWFEYREAVPKGFNRLLGKIAHWTDSGKKVHLFTGNHDMWIFDFFTKELGVIIYRQPQIFEWDGLKILIGHGDGLGPGDYKYKFLKNFFASKICQWLFGWIHPDLGISLALFFSRSSRKKTAQKEDYYFGASNEWLEVYCNEASLNDPSIDYFIFGHRHLPIYKFLENKKSMYVNLGDWLNYFTYAILEKNKVSLLQYESTQKDLDFSYSSLS
jgi:UDP-2,3-diacylglucosamine hydrolase